MSKLSSKKHWEEEKVVGKNIHVGSLVKENIERLLILLLVLSSGSIYFSSKFLFYSFIVVFLVYLLRNKNIQMSSKYNFNVFIIFSLILMIQVLLTLEYNIPLKDIGHIIVYLLILSSLQSNMLRSSFISKYVNIITVICLISLACFSLVNLFSINTLPFQKTITSFDGLTSRDATPYYTVRVIMNDYGIIDQKRNSGLFWEPGAFQSFISMAILMIIANLKQIKRLDLFKLLILIVTLLTTQSTTGYIILLLLLIFLGINSKRCHKNVRYLLTFLFIVILIILIFNYQLIYNSINDKLLNQSGSYSTRILIDTVGGFQQFLNKSMLGYGFNSDYLSAVFKSIGVQNNSNGLIILLMQCGLFVAIPYMIFLFKGLKKFFKPNPLNFLIILVVFFMIHSSESFIFSPIFLSFLFKWKTNSNQVNESQLSDSKLSAA